MRNVFLTPGTSSQLLVQANVASACEFFYVFTPMKQLSSITNK